MTISISPAVARRLLQLCPAEDPLHREVLARLVEQLEPLWRQRGLATVDPVQATASLRQWLRADPEDAWRWLEQAHPTPLATGRRNPRGRKALSFLKWAGSKLEVMPQLLARMPRSFRRYYEPMVGSGTVWLSLRPRRAVLGDVNAELVNCYRVIRDHLPALVAALGTHPNDEDHYLEVRAQNPGDLDPVSQAARTIYLNKTCFNGLYRVNKSGRFNVPFGRVTWANTCDVETLARVHRALQGVTVREGDFETCLQGAGEGDLVYLDPPYLSPGAQPTIFYAYQPLPFDEAQHRRLARTFAELDRRGCAVVASNSDVPLVHELYRDYTIEVIPVTRRLNCVASRRKGWQEVIITNRRCRRAHR